MALITKNSVLRRAEDPRLEMLRLRTSIWPDWYGGASMPAKATSAFLDWKRRTSPISNMSWGPRAGPKMAAAHRCILLLETISVFCGISGVSVTYPRFSYTTVGGQGGEPFAYNRCYLYLQFIACFFVVGTTASLFEETFRRTSRQYIRTLPLGTARVILVRYIKLLLFVLIPYVPTVLFIFIRANASL